MLTRSIGRYLSWPLDRLAALIAPTGVPPNVITWSALFLNLWAGILFASGRFAAAGGMMILAGLCDLLDGPVARHQNRVSIFGGFLDSILDRYADLILFLGLLVYYTRVNRFLYAVLVGAAMAGAVMVSYAKARAETLVPKTDVGFWDRPERLALMILGALVNRMPIVLWILAIGSNITVIHRIVSAWKLTKGAALPQAASQGAGSRPPGLRSTSVPPSVSREAPETRPVLTRTARRGG
ncbi:MAG: CDP-alcohol phosphatidyltransferase family protein [Candidatus Acidiferrales bacterium]